MLSELLGRPLFFHGEVCHSLAERVILGQGSKFKVYGFGGVGHSLQDV